VTFWGAFRIPILERRRDVLKKLLGVRYSLRRGLLLFVVGGKAVGDARPAGWALTWFHNPPFCRRTLRKTISAMSNRRLSRLRTNSAFGDALRTLISLNDGLFSCVQWKGPWRIRRKLVNETGGLCAMDPVVLIGAFNNPWTMAAGLSQLSLQLLQEKDNLIKIIDPTKKHAARGLTGRPRNSPSPH